MVKVEWSAETYLVDKLLRTTIKLEEGIILLLLETWNEATAYVESKICSPRDQIKDELSPRDISLLRTPLSMLLEPFTNTVRLLSDHKKWQAHLFAHMPTTTNSKFHSLLRQSLNAI